MIKTQKNIFVTVTCAETPSKLNQSRLAQKEFKNRLTNKQNLKNTKFLPQ